jgi:NDP-sugar pyrophosphorylase family protein
MSIMPKSLNIFILAAGVGERLRPITNHIPKPLLPIVGKPVLEFVLEKILVLYPDNIAINLHYKGKQIRDYINGSPFRDRIRFFSEDPLLGTGGALKNAEALLSKGTFLVHNSDIISDIDLEALLEFHYSSRNAVTLAVHDYPRFNNVIVDENGFFKGINSLSENQNVKAFTGIAVYEPEFLKFLPSGISSVVDAWVKAVEAGYKIGTIDFTGCYWNDIGTPQAYASAIIDALRVDGETIYIHPKSQGCENATLNGYVVIEEGSLISGGSFRNCIILKGSDIKCGNYENCIIGPDFEINITETEMLGALKDNELIFIGSGGSDRRYYRQRTEDRRQTTVVVCYSPDGPDFYRHIEYTKFFRRHGIPVPELLDVNYEKMTAVFEDLGDLSLYSWLKCPRDEHQIEDMYKKVMDIAALIHSNIIQNISECLLLEERIFDFEHFRWESDYFIERFVKQLRGVDIENISALNEELHRLAQKADSYSKTVIHRDFQSQNIMITKGVPRLIDYQGARIGPPTYDIASMLWDPYFRLDDNMRGRLLEYYIDQMEKSTGYGFDRDIFFESLLLCRIQRHMQALGAYGFLSSVKGKKYFLKHIPEGLRLLKEDMSVLKQEYPVLHDLIGRL